MTVASPAVSRSAYRFPVLGLLERPFFLARFFKRKWSVLPGHGTIDVKRIKSGNVVSVVLKSHENSMVRQTLSSDGVRVLRTKHMREVLVGIQSFGNQPGSREGRERTMISFRKREGLVELAPPAGPLI